LVTFTHSKAKSFDLVFAHAQYGEGHLHFAKVAKYVLDINATAIPKTIF